MTDLSNSQFIDPAYLPQSKDSWHIAVRKLRTWIMYKEDNLVRPYIMVVLNLDAHMIIATDLKPDEPTTDDVRYMLISAMSNPKAKPWLVKQEPKRPACVFFEDRRLLNELKPVLQEINIQSRWRSKSKIIDSMITEMETRMKSDEPQIPGLLEQKGVTPRIISAMYSAAVEFYRAAPWIKLSNLDILAITVPPNKEPYFSIIMGQGGMEYGLTLHKTWDDVLSQYDIERPEEMFSSQERHVLLFNHKTEVPHSDLDDQEAFGWELPEPNIYPVPLIFVSMEEVHRPTKEELQWYEAALRAILVFVEEHLTLDEFSRPQPTEKDIQVTTSLGKITVKVKYPGGKLPANIGASMDDIYLDEGESPQPPIDPRVIESDMTRALGSFIEPLVASEVAQAQDLIYKAWEESNPAKRIILAYQALNISTDCADAYVLLAEEEADTPITALEFYRQGVEAGRRALGEDYFEENRGHFWGLVETRPYMRAMEGMATCLWELNRADEAIQIYKEMLLLNPGDNQGIRYTLVQLLLDLNMDSDLEQLIQEYEEDWSAIWKYTTALLVFRQHGITEEATKALKDALEQNPYVPDYLIGRKRIPSAFPVYIGIGDENEAVHYAAYHLNYWRRTPGAIEWLTDYAAQSTPPSKKVPRKPHKKGKGRKSKSAFHIGSSVKVKPDFIIQELDLDISGWCGRVAEYNEDESTVLVKWDSLSLRKLPPEYIEECEQDGIAWDGIFLPANELMPTKPKDTPEERQEVYEKMSFHYFWTSFGEQGARIQTLLADIDPKDYQAALQKWMNHLNRNLKLPLEVQILEEIVSQVSEIIQASKQLKLVNLDRVDDILGVIGLVETEDEQTVLPLFFLEVMDKDSINFRLLDDYNTWFASNFISIDD